MNLQKNIYNSGINKLIDTNIQEYDIRSAALIGLKQFNNIEYNRLKNMNKLERNIEIGKLIKNNPNIYNEIYNIHILNAKNRFINENNIKKEKILETTIDSITFFNTSIMKVKFDDFIFVKKNNGFSSFYRLPKMKLYYNGSNNDILVKGVSNKDLKNTAFFKEYFSLLLKKLEISRKFSLIRLFGNFRELYFNNINKNIYKSFLKDNKFVYINNNKEILIDVYNKDLSGLNISDNYMDIIFPLMNLFKNDI